MDFYKSTTFYLVLIKSPWAFKVPKKKNWGRYIYIIIENFIKCQVF